MKKIKTITLFIFCAFLINLGCSKSDDTIPETPEEQGEDPMDEEENPDTEGVDYTQETINIVLPSDSELDLSNFKVQSVVDDFDIDANGSSTANFLEGRTSIAYVIDENDNPILAGFINSEKREISVRSTVEVSLYYNLGTIFLPSEIKEIYIKEISKGINIDDTVINSESIFVSNSSLIGLESFLNEIQALAEKFTKDFNDGTEQSKTSSGIRFPNITKSGIRVEEESGNKILFRNTERRRAHAFLYKTKTTNEDNQETILIDDIVNENSITSTQVNIPPTAAVTSVIGLLQTVVAGKGLEIGAINSEPTVLTITGDNLKETYKARVIGPGLPPVPDLTEEEFQKLSDLNIETFAFDILLPIISTAIGENDNVFSELKPSNPNAIGFINFVKAGINSLNGGNDAANKGEFDTLLRAYIGGVIDGALAESFEGAVKNAVNLISITASSSGQQLSEQVANRIASKVDKFFAALRIADFVLQGIDLVRISGAIATSNSLEIFEIEVNRGIVALEPYLAKTKFGEEDVEYTAEVIGQDLAAGQAFEYVWTSDGDFGILVDDNTGRTDVKTLTTSANKIKYRAEAAGNGSDEIKVEVFIKEGVNRTRVDDDSAFVDVIASELEITPNNAIISGGFSLPLSVVDEKGKELVSDENFEYSFEWRTDGKYGQFNGTRNRITTKVNNVKYEALERTLEGSENIAVSIYRKETGNSGSYRFLQTVEGIINVKNDPNKKYFTVSASDWVWDSFPESGGTREVRGAGFKIPIHDNAISYKLEILDYSIVAINGNVITRSGTFTWTNESQSDPIYLPPNDLGNYVAYISSLSINTENTDYGAFIDYITSRSGTAQVIITLEDN